MLIKKSTLLSIDAFSKAEEDVRIRTRSGAIITISCIVITSILLLNQWIQFNQIITRPTLVMDRERNLQLELNLDITFPHMPCDLINFDILDDSGVLQLDQTIVSDEGFTKTRIDSVGKELDSKNYKLNDQVMQYPPNDENYCGPCYGSIDQTANDKETDMSKKICCQTCQDVKDAYMNIGWGFFDGKNIEQCEREGYVDKVNKHINEGCRIKGSALLNRIGGNIHFAPGQAFQNARGHFHDTSFYDIKTELNFNHIINHLSFGKPIKNKQENLRNLKLETNPLDGQQTLPHHDTHSRTFTYFAKIVPTRYEYLDNIIVETAQFSTKFHEKPVNGGNDYDDPKIKHQRGGIPGLFIYFDMSPLKVINREEHAISWSSFILNCITSVGGILAVGTVCDKILYKTQRTFFKKNVGGKSE